MQERAKLIQDNIGKVIIGKENVVRHILTAMISGGHVLLEDVPGTGKTRMARALAASMGLDFGRVQFTPDMLPADVTGLHIYNRQSGEFELKKGPVFTNILLADEINRATPRTQSGLLECMEERQVTIDGVTQKLDEPFFVIATQNPIETAGTFPLPEAQMDRFFMRLSMGLPERDEEIRILETYRESDPLKDLTSVVTKEELMEMKKAADEVYVHPLIEAYLVDIVRATRDSSRTLMGVSPRGTIAFLRAARCWAWLDGSDYVRPDDVKAVAPAVLAHRLVLSYGQNRYQDAVRMICDICESIPAPTENLERR